MPKAESLDDASLATCAASIAAQLDRIGRLLAIVAIRDQEDDADKIAILAGVGYTHAEIGKFVGKKPDAVRMTLSRSRSNKRRG